jgi:methionyl aminopeptidase
MITIKNKNALEKMKQAGARLATIFEELSAVVRAGVSTHDIDQWIDAQLRAHELVSAMKGYKGYKHSSCISLNDEVVHGVPQKSTIIRAGDIVKVDVCASWQGYCADMARTFYSEPVPEKIKAVVRAAHDALDAGIAQAYVGNKLSNISVAIQEKVEQEGFGVVRDFAGHGIGKQMHEDPEIPNYGRPNGGPILQQGMAFALEPMVTMGHYDIYIEKDGWTVKTVDKSYAVHVEDTVLITQQGPFVTTRLNRAQS